MFAIEDWSKDKVHTVMRELLFSFNYMWFLMEDWIKRNCPEKLDNEDFQNLAEAFGQYQARRLEKTVDGGGLGLDRLVQFVRHSHWCAFEEIELTRMSDTHLRMRTLGCTAQKAAHKWGMPHYDCSQSGLRLRRGFFGRVTPGAEVTRVFSPPDTRPEEIPETVSCEWMITIE